MIITKKRQKRWFDDRAVFKSLYPNYVVNIHNCINEIRKNKRKNLIPDICEKHNVSLYKIMQIIGLDCGNIDRRYFKFLD